ncbi:MAG: hypothetical protein ACRDT0_15660 [Pseudonocardiaceae bacterium]
MPHERIRTKFPEFGCELGEGIRRMFDTMHAEGLRPRLLSKLATWAHLLRAPGAAS